MERIKAGLKYNHYQSAFAVVHSAECDRAEHEAASAGEHMAEECEEALSLGRLGTAVHAGRLDGLDRGHRDGLLRLVGLGLLHLCAGLGLVDLQVFGVLLDLQQGMRGLQGGLLGLLRDVLLLGQ